MLLKKCPANVCHWIDWYRYCLMLKYGCPWVHAGMSSDTVLSSNRRSISSDTSEVPRASLLELEVSADIFWFKHGQKNVAMLHCFLQGGSPIVLPSGPAGQLDFESNRMAIKITQTKIFRSFLCQANNQITIRYKRQALHKNKRTKVRLAPCA